MAYSYPNSISKVFFNLKKAILLFTILLFSSFVRGQFSLASNNKTILCPNVANGSTGTVNGVVYTKVNRSDLQAKIGANQDVSCVCTTGISNMSGLFQSNSSFNQDISSWDTSSVSNMQGLFQNAGSFNQDIGYWDVSSMNDQNGVNQLFDNAGSLNQDLSYWCFPSGGSASNIYQNRQNIWGNNNPIKNNTSLRPRFAVANNCVAAKVGPAVNNSSPSTLTITSSDSDNIITSGVVTLTATFSENMAATPLISIAGLVTNTAMTQGSSAAQWTYYWPIPSSVTTGTYAVTVAATDTSSLAYDGSTSLNLSIDPMFYLDTNGVTIKCKGCSAGDTGYLGGVLYTAHDNTSIAAKDINDPDWDRVVTTLVTSLYRIFYNDRTFNQNIGSWDTSNVTNMVDAFWLANAFDQDISNWDVSSVTNMGNMFMSAETFDQDISNWNVANVTNMSRMFNDAASFNQDIGGWDVSNVTNMSQMFLRAVFNQNIGNWNTSKVINMSGLFQENYYFNNGDASGVTSNTMNWDVSNVTNMSNMFEWANKFNQDIGSWVTSSVTNMSYMFHKAERFNQDIGSWDVASVLNMNYIFYELNYNQNISSWDVSSVTDMRSMFFRNRTFNQNIGSWDVSSVTDMDSMFRNADDFNQDISSWCVINITSKPDDFDEDARSWLSINKPIWGTCPSQATLTLTSSDSDNVITSGVVTVTATFSENMAATPLVSIAGLVTNTAMTQGADATEWTYYWQVPSSVTTGTYAVTVAATDTNSRPYGGSESLDVSIDPMFYLDANGVTIKCSGCSAGDTGYVGGVLYTTYDNNSLNAKSLNDADWGGVVTSLVTDMSDLFYGNGPNDRSNLTTFFNANDITSWDTSNVTNFHGMFEMENDQYMSFNQNISNWDTSSAQDMSYMFFNQSTFNQNIGNWDTSGVTSMSRMFSGADAFNNGTAPGLSTNTMNWDTSNVTDMNRMFSSGAMAFNVDIDSWDVSSVIDMTGMFESATTFNQDLNTWDVSSVTTMTYMFSTGRKFNGDISSWDVSNVTNMRGMFDGAYDFNQDIGNWNTSSVTTMEAMFTDARAFNQNIGSWDVTSVTTFYRLFQVAQNFNNGDAAGVTSNTMNWDVSNNTNFGQMFYGTKFNQDLSGWCVPLISSEHSGFSANSPLSNENKPIWGSCNSQATLTLTSSDSDNIITSGVVTITGTFSENIAATPLISIAGLVTNTTMTQGSSAAEWTYYWQVPSSVSTGTYAVTLSATDTYSRPYAGSESLDLSIDTMFYLDPNGVTIKCKGCSAGDTGYIGNVLYTAHDNTSIAEKPRSDSDWDRVVTTLVTDMSELFMAEVINGQVNPIPDGISSWDTSNVTSFEDMFLNYNSSNFSGFNQDISKWDTSSATTMHGMFQNQASFNIDLSSWDTSNVIDMEDMFFSAREFNQNIGNWDVSSVTDMQRMFMDAEKFNNGEVVPVGAKDASENNNPLNWDVSNVTTMYRMFNAAENFNQDISFWDVTKVETVEEMFGGAYQFNCDISGWDVSNITNFESMLAGPTFLLIDLSGWCTINSMVTGPYAYTWFGYFRSDRSLMPVWGTCPPPTSNATLTLSSNDSDNIITSGVVTLTATFSENMAATPLISIAGLVTNTAMTQGSTSTTWTYYWQVPSSVTTGHMLLQ